MPWREQNLMTIRQEFVQLALQRNSNLTSLCERFNISRKTGYKWLNRFKEDGKKGLSNQSTRPTTSPRETSQLMINLICEVREKHPCWGGLKIQAVLKRRGVGHVPSASCIQKILKAEGYIIKSSHQKSKFNRFEHEAPNRLWQMDFKGYFDYERGRCHPLTIIDDHSRFSIGLHACPNERGVTVKQAITPIFKRYGLPERINVDNGNPWGSVFTQSRYSTFSVWLIKVGICVSHSRPYHPQTNGKDERFHRTLKEELINYRYFRNLKHIQREFDDWRDIYNLERPHQAINMQVPADKYQPSYREFNESIADFDYADDYLIHKVDKRGRLFLKNRQLFVGVPFSQEYCGIRLDNHQDGLVHVFFRQQKLGQIDLSIINKGEMVNLYSSKVLST